VAGTGDIGLGLDQCTKYVKRNCFWATVCKTVRDMLLDRCLCPVLSLCNVGVLCMLQTVGWIKMKLGAQTGLGPGHIVLDGDPAPPPPRGHSLPIFGPYSYLLRPNGCLDQDATWYGDKLRPKQHCVRWGPSPPPQKGTDAQFSDRVYCGQTAGWSSGVTFRRPGAEAVKCAPPLESRHVSLTPTVHFLVKYTTLVVPSRQLPCNSVIFL